MTKYFQLFSENDTTQFMTIDNVEKYSYAAQQDSEFYFEVRILMSE